MLIAVSAIAVVALIVALAALVLSLQQRQLGHRLLQERKDLASGPLASPQEEQSGGARFSTRLQRVEQEQSRTAPQPALKAEKYRYVVALAKQGHPVTEIAAALHMAVVEVEQVIRLAQLNKAPEQ